MQLRKECMPWGSLARSKPSSVSVPAREGTPRCSWLMKDWRYSSPLPMAPTARVRRGVRAAGRHARSSCAALCCRLAQAGGHLMSMASCHLNHSLIPTTVVLLLANNNSTAIGKMWCIVLIEVWTYCMDLELMRK
jgi:hypothetical protein